MNLFENQKEFEEKYFCISGTDEAGRGPIAGPVVVSSVVLPKNSCIKGINDSKKLSKAKRDYFYQWIVENATSYSIKIISPEEIDKINILQATLKGMKESLLGLSCKPDLALIDGNHIPRVSDYNLLPVIKGDGKYAVIAAASILAKVTRDRIMEELCLEYPCYGFSKHKGYPTAVHLSAIQKHGICDHHRKSYKPVSQLLLTFEDME